MAVEVGKVDFGILLDDRGDLAGGDLEIVDSFCRKVRKDEVAALADLLTVKHAIGIRDPGG